ncbi:hypothetical protein ACM01_01675 [Streptomyces viridochromogenes]|uniref:Sodium:dicarboxylate symporter n=1 Tax=Streptomyces viridochromogenes TaxID=1938 RepID=A0A0J8CH74_STRVR|nr:hypothetical protein ACM01_01675 [Streptomyces viridochromogenes]KOG19077.1 hypothetical protein ADK36_20805 [Streptomyces viridochromogenes]KOG19316.1 hypothetical protein ADK35_20665 [Streptomyces viridochromogenes]
MLIFGIDEFMSECRALTNLAGNSVATLAVARWANVLDTERVNRALRTGKPRPEPLGTHPRPGSSSRHAREERRPDAYARLGAAATGRAQARHGMSRRAEVGG